MLEENQVPLSHELKRKQLKLWAMGFGLLMLIMLGLWLLNDETPTSTLKSELRENAPVYDVTKAVDDKSYWVFKSEQRLSEQSEKQADILKQIEEIKGSLHQNPEQLAKEQEKDNLILALKTKLEKLEEKVEQQALTLEQNLSKEGFAKTQGNDQSIPDANYYGKPVFKEVNGKVEALSLAPTILSENIVLETLNSGPGTRHHIDSYIPAGSYAKAILLNGVDISAGVSSQTNPKPVLLRLVDQGSLPNKALGQMKDCRIIAAAYGDLSSERAYMRLEKLSCTECDGHVIETDVDGYISGEDGKNGIRGRVITRDGELLKKGFIGGLFSGLGKASAQSFGTTSISPLGVTTAVAGTDVLKKAGAEGVGNAFDLLAKYNIQRAEQYQPVIQISAGRVVEVIFHSGSQFGEQKLRKEASKEHPKPVNPFGE